MKKLFAALLSFSFFFSESAFSQVVWTSPLFPAANGAVTIYFDATQGNQGLANYSGDVYIFTGVITNLSSGPSDWKHVNTTWGSGDPAFKMTSLGNHLYSYYIANINTFYGVSGNEYIEQLALLFTNTDGSLAGRDVGDADIFYDVWDGVSLEAKFLTPAITPDFVNLNDAVNTIAVSSKPATITLYQNNNFIAQFTNTDSVNYTFTAATYGTTWIKAVVDDGMNVVSDSVSYVVNPPVITAALPAGTDVGINYINDSTVTLVLVAPGKQFVYALGDFSNWALLDSNYMKRTPDGNDWWVTLHHLVPQQEYRYQFLVDGSIYIADPYSDKILDPVNDPFITADTYPDLTPYPTGLATGSVSIFETGQTQYTWHDSGYVRPKNTELIIYELLVRDFVGAHDYQTLLDTLNYMKQLGINAIEIMPFVDFSGNLSWGYNPNFYFAPDKYYGPKDDLKAFIDACHQDGIAVIEDIVFNQSDAGSPMCEMYWDAVNNIPAIDNPWYNQYAPHPYSVFYDFNHESTYTRNFIDDVLKYWTTEYHIDGYRFDLSKGFTQTPSTEATVSNYDASRIYNIERIADQIRTVDSNSILILEHFCNDDEEQVLSAYGLMLWANLSYAYEQSAMGYSSGCDLSRIAYTSHGFTEPHAVGYMESHDEERMMYKEITYGNHTASYDVRPLDSALNRMKEAACFFFPVPGPKMIWQFEELGYDYSIGYNGSNTAPKPIRWDYLSYNPRKLLNQFFSVMINLKKDYTVFNSGTIAMNVNTLYKSIRLTDANLKVCILGNFDVVSGNVTPYFPGTGKWYEYFTGDSITVNDVNAPINLKPGEYRLYTDKKLQQPDLGNVGVNDPQPLNRLQLDCFPNPAGDHATLDFYLPDAGNTSLSLFDSGGMKIADINQGPRGSGWFTVNVPTRHLANGLYFVELAVNGLEKTVKLNVQH